ncbi:MAG: hypothetical protein HQK52_19430 [Oligoflexia bacterium]|nr:hypothetical protein [Oligoflexia bacterium]
MSSYTEPKFKAFYAQTKLLDNQFNFVAFGDADDKITLSNGTNNVVGVLMNRPNINQIAEVALTGGGAQLRISSGVARGDLLTSDTKGQGKKVTVNGENVYAIAMMSGVEGEVISVDLVRSQAVIK